MRGVAQSTTPKGVGAPKRIVVLFHPGDRYHGPSTYIVDHLARCWREDGHAVTYVFGTRRVVGGDLVFLHVNLSVVPEEYLDFASRYPIIVNGRIRDIRKSTTSQNLLCRDDPWSGRVIVKSDLNYAGEPERMLRRSWLWHRSTAWRALGAFAAGPGERGDPFRSWRDYVVYDRLSDVPDAWFNDPRVVVERFKPEFEDGLYHLRMYQFLGNRGSWSRLASPQPLVKAGSSVRVERVEPEPEIVAWRERLGMDYGKLDYVRHNGEVVLLDANKTTGASLHMDEATLREVRRYQAEGLYGYFA